MALGILDQLGLAASLVFAIPVAAYGLQQAAGGSPAVGAAFVVVAALMVYLPQRLTTPGDIPGKAAEKAVGTAIGNEREGEGVGDTDGRGDAADGAEVGDTEDATAGEHATRSDGDATDRA